MYGPLKKLAVVAKRSIFWLFQFNSILNFFPIQDWIFKEFFFNYSHNIYLILILSQLRFGFWNRFIKIGIFCALQIVIDIILNRSLMECHHVRTVQSYLGLHPNFRKPKLLVSHTVIKKTSTQLHVQTNREHFFKTHLNSIICLKSWLATMKSVSVFVTSPSPSRRVTLCLLASYVIQGELCDSKCWNWSWFHIVWWTSKIYKNAYFWKSWKETTFKFRRKYFRSYVWIQSSIWRTNPHPIF